MIKSNNGEVKLEGTKELILVDLSTLVHALHYDLFIDKEEMTAEESKDTIMDAVNLGFKSFDQVKDEAKETLIALIDKIKEMIEGKDDE